MNEKMSKRRIQIKDLQKRELELLKPRSQGKSLKKVEKRIKIIIKS